MQDKINSFTPIIGKESKLLILGTLPSVKSLRIKQYYGNPQNTFWKILTDVILFVKLALLDMLA